MHVWYGLAKSLGRPTRDLRHKIRDWKHENREDAREEDCEDKAWKSMQRVGTRAQRGREEDSTAAEWEGKMVRWGRREGRGTRGLYKPTKGLYGGSART